MIATKEISQSEKEKAKQKKKKNMIKKKKIVALKLNSLRLPEAADSGRPATSQGRDLAAVLEVQLEADQSPFALLWPCPCR